MANQQQLTNTLYMEIRAVQQPITANERNISGHAIVFDSESRVMYDEKTKRYFIEIISPSAIDEDFINTQDVKALYNHDRDLLLARSMNGAGSLKLTIDEVGLRYDFDSPETTLGNDILVLIKRGDLWGSSFSFYVDSKNERWVYDSERKIWKRYIDKITLLTDVSVVNDPAYMSTDVSARMIDELPIPVAEEDEPQPEEPIEPEEEVVEIIEPQQPDERAYLLGLYELYLQL